VNLKLITHLVAVLYVLAVQVLPVLCAKSLFAMPVVNTAMLPTFVPASIVKGKETVALGDPTAWEPMFTLRWAPVKVTCAPTAIGNITQHRAAQNLLRFTGLNCE